MLAAETPPAGGGETGQIVIGTVGGAILTAAMFALVLGHRSGRVQLLNRAGALAERQTGLPGWCAVPLTVLSTSLIVAVFGMYWDIATHIDSGRDEGPFANASHYFILVGLFGIFAAGLIAIFMPQTRPSRSAVPLPSGWDAPLGGVLIMICAVISLSAFPLDDLWHRIFGQDVTLYGPTHLLLFGGAALSVLGALVLMSEGLRARELGGQAGAPEGATDGARPRFARDEPRSRQEQGAGLRRLLTAGFAGAFLIALSTFQGEYDYAVPQFKLVLHPVLLMIAASIALITARVYVGRGGALAAALFFILIRGALSLLVSPTFGHTGLHFPLYLVEAAVVELVALRIDPRRPVAFGLAAGAAIGTFGLAAEWAWSYVWWTIEWPASLLPEAAIAGFVAAVAGGVLGGVIGNGLSPEPAPDRPSWVAPALAGAVLIAVLAYAVPVTSGDPIRASVELTEVDPAPQRTVHATARLEPPGAADEAHWFVSTAWQGQEGRSVVDPLEEVSPGVWRTTKPVPVYGTWKASLRLHKGHAVQGLAVYFPEDPAIPAKAIPAEAAFERSFVKDKELLQREQKPGVSPALTTIAYLIVLLVAILLVASLAAGIRRLAQAGDEDEGFRVVPATAEESPASSLRT
jgi:hypothetical protein